MLAPYITHPPASQEQKPPQLQPPPTLKAANSKGHEIWIFHQRDHKQRPSTSLSPNTKLGQRPFPVQRCNRGGTQQQLRRQQQPARCKNKGRRNESSRWQVQNQTRDSGFSTHNPAKRFRSLLQDVVHAKHLHKLEERPAVSQNRHP